MASSRKQAKRRSSSQSLIHIEVESGPGKGDRIEILEGETSIGRSDDCNFQIDSDAASRLHATVFRQGDVVVIRDENSHNGTYVNESEIDGDMRLEAGDRIQVGDSVLCLVVNGVRERASDDGDGPGISKLQKAGIFLFVLVICTSVFIILLPRLGFLTSKLPDIPKLSVITDPAAPSAPTTSPNRPVPVAVPQLAAVQGSGVQHPQAAFSTSDATPSPAAPTAVAAPVALPSASAIPPPVSAASVYRKSDSNVADKSPTRRKTGTGNKSKDERRARGMYVQGDVAGALELAEEIGASRLAEQIRSFQQAEGEAKAAFSFKKGTDAIESYEAADEVDEEITSAYSKDAVSVPGRRVRKALSNLYQQAGEAFFKRHENEKAADFFERSLEYDRGNARSREFLKKLGRSEDAEDSEDDEG